MAGTKEQKAESDNALVKSLARLTKPKFQAAAPSFKPIRNQNLSAFEVLWDVITMYRKIAARVRKLSGENLFYETSISPTLLRKGDHLLHHLDGRPCFGSLDLGWRDDQAAFVKCFEIENEADPEKPFFEFVIRAWIPADGPRDLNQQPFRRLSPENSL